MFGGTLIAQVSKEASAFAAPVPNVPLLVVKCITRVEKHMKEEGIYRKSGQSTKIQQCVAQCNADVAALNLNSEDIHVVSGLLKRYFRDL